MSGIAHYHLHEQSDHTQQLATLSAQTPSANVTQTSVPASFSQLSSFSQPMITQPVASTPSSTARQTTLTSMPASFEQLEQYARMQGMSENQIALVKRLSQPRTSRADQPWSMQAGGVRGIRNNNPGNLEASWAFTWLGQNGTDGRFATFTSPEHGIRALGMNLLSYQRRGLDTISKIISRWAPPQDNNNTPAYIQNVSNALGVSPDTRLDVASPTVLSALSKAIIRQENGGVPFSDEVINSGVSSALGVDALSDSAPSVLQVRKN